MPKYRVVCTTIETHVCLVEAPSEEAAQAWYDDHSDCGGSGFEKEDA